MNGGSRREAAAKVIGFLLCALIAAFNLSPEMAAVRELSDTVYVGPENAAGVFEGIGNIFTVSDASGTEVGSSLSETLGGGEYEARFAIEFLGVKVKEVTVRHAAREMVIPGGQSIGVSVRADGVLIVAVDNVDGPSGRYSPAREAGLDAGDVIIKVDGAKVEGVDSLIALCEAAEGECVFSVMRDGAEHALRITPERSGGGAELGIWVRESSAGIGTLSFACMSDLAFGALGHAVSDPDTGALIPVRSGEIVAANIVGVSLGEQGTPGELKGTFGTLSRKLGKIMCNTEHGVYGYMYGEVTNGLYPDGVELAYPDELVTGPAVLLSSIDSDGVRAYDCEIIKLYKQSGEGGKGMVIRITDRELIEKTGGIVQGMSGSPIIQDGRLAGAVTHVFINDPLKGYGVYSLWMYERCRGLSGENRQ